MQAVRAPAGGARKRVFNAYEDEDEDEDEDDDDHDDDHDDNCAEDEDDNETVSRLRRFQTFAARNSVRTARSRHELVGMVNTPIS